VPRERAHGRRASLPERGEIDSDVRIDDSHARETFTSDVNGAITVVKRSLAVRIAIATLVNESVTVVISGPEAPAMLSGCSPA
jgi:hypothetical protein